VRNEDLVQAQVERALGIVFEFVEELGELVIDDIKLLKNMTLLGWSLAIVFQAVNVVMDAAVKVGRIYIGRLSGGG